MDGNLTPEGYHPEWEPSWATPWSPWHFELEISSAGWSYKNPDYCDTFWGSHGCALDPGHEGPCMCITVFYDEDGEVEEESCEGCCAPPYFGPDTHFMSNWGTPTPEATLAAAKG